MSDREHNPPPQDRRRLARYSRRIPLHLSNERHEMLEGDPVLVDVSLEGLCYESKVPGVVGATVNFRLQVPGKGSASGIGRIRWTRPAKAGAHLSGIRFETFGWVNHEKLREYLEPYFKRGSGFTE